MNRNEAIEKSLTVKWKVDVCTSGEECWCRIIKCDPPLMYKENDSYPEEEYFVSRAGELNEKTAKHIVRVHNALLEE